MVPSDFRDPWDRIPGVPGLFQQSRNFQVTVNPLEWSTVQLNVQSAGLRNISWESVGNSKAQVGHSRPTTSEFLETGPGTCVFNKISNQSWKITCEEFLISLHASLCLSTFVWNSDSMYLWGQQTPVHIIQLFRCLCPIRPCWWQYR